MRRFIPSPGVIFLLTAISLSVCHWRLTAFPFAERAAFVLMLFLFPLVWLWPSAIDWRARRLFDDRPATESREFIWIALGALSLPLFAIRAFPLLKPIALPFFLAVYGCGLLGIAWITSVDPE